MHVKALSRASRAGLQDHFFERLLSLIVTITNRARISHRFDHSCQSPRFDAILISLAASVRHYSLRNPLADSPTCRTINDSSSPTSKFRS
jgi:hypothetical protein